MCFTCTGNPKVNFDFDFFDILEVRKKKCWRSYLPTAKAVKTLENNFSDRLPKEAFEISTISEI